MLLSLLLLKKTHLMVNILKLTEYGIQVQQILLSQDHQLAS